MSATKTMEMKIEDGGGRKLVSRKNSLKSPRLSLKKFTMVASKRTEFEMVP